MSIQLSNTGTNAVTAIINKVFEGTTGQKIKDILYSNDTGVMAVRDVYPVQQGADVKHIDDVVKLLYTIYKDVVTMINTPGHPAEGVLSGFESDTGKGSLQSQINVLKGALAKPENEGFSVELMPENKFSSLLRDAYIAGTIRGMRILALLSLEEFSGNMSKLFTPDNINKYIDTPMPEFNPDDYTGKDARIKHHRLWFPHEHDSKLPWTPLAPQTLAIFLRKPGVFPKAIRKMYGVDADHVLKTYPSDKFDVPDESLHEGARPIRDMDSESRSEPFIPGLDYVLVFLKMVLRNLASGHTSEDDLYKVFSAATSNIATTAEENDNEIKIGGVEGDDPDAALDTFSQNTAASQYDALLSKEEGGGGDKLAAGVFSEFGNEDRHIITLLCHEALNELCEEQPDYADLFQFHVLEATSNAGELGEKNLYYEYFDRFFERFSSSEAGAVLVYQLYNSIGKSNIPYTVERLRRLRDELPKNNTDIVLATSTSNDLLTKVNTTDASEAIRVAVDVTKNVLKDIAGKYNKEELSIRIA